MSFLFDIGGDSSGFERTLEGMDQMGERFAHKFSHHLSKAFGVAFLATQGVKAIEQIFGRPEELENMSRKWGYNVEQIQLLEHAAKQAGTTFEDFMEKAKSGVYDLSFALDEMRKKGVHVIPRENIEELNRNREAVKSAFQGAIDFGMVNPTGGTLRAFRELMSGNFREAAKLYFKSRVYQPDQSGLSPEDHSGYGSAGPSNIPYIDHQEAAKVAKESKFRGRIDTLARMELLFGDKLKSIQELHRSGGGRALSEWNPVTGYIKAGPGTISTEERKLEHILDSIREEAKLTNLELAKLRRGE